jgi:hypothetical protein
MTQTNSTNTLPLSYKVVVKTTGRVLFQGNGYDVVSFFFAQNDRTISNLSIVEYNS